MSLYSRSCVALGVYLILAAVGVHLGILGNLGLGLICGGAWAGR